MYNSWILNSVNTSDTYRSPYSICLSGIFITPDNIEVCTHIIRMPTKRRNFPIEPNCTCECVYHPIQCMHGNCLHYQVSSTCQSWFLKCHSRTVKDEYVQCTQVGTQYTHTTKKFLIRRQSLMSHWTTYYCCLLRVLANENYSKILCKPNNIFLPFFVSNMNSRIRE